VAFRLFLKSQTSNSPKDVIPELVDFFTKQQASYILLIDYELLLQNDAFEEKKMLEIMEEKDDGGEELQESGSDYQFGQFDYLE
jgi:hypothetical protein